MLSTPTTAKLYGQDFAQWIDQTVQQLKEGKLDELDIENLIEEVESLGRSDKRVLSSNLMGQGTLGIARSQNKQKGDRREPAAKI
ncbi:MAG: DUF29 domain-containing protein [Thermosynechococcaceae cyanobacterium]